MYKKALLMLILAVFATYVSAQVKVADKKEKPLKRPATETAKSASVDVAKPVEAKPTGPVAFGPIKFDLTKEALEALQSNDGVYLTAPLTVKDMKSKLEEGTVWYDGQLNVPQAASPVKAIFVFKNGKMTYFSMDFHEITWEYMQKQIAEKYGSGEAKDDQKEEQCIYKNGSNFKLINGIKSVTWRQVVSPTEQVTTTASDMRFAMCPFSLRDSLFSTKTTSISFSLSPIKREEKKSLF